MAEIYINQVPDYGASETDYPNGKIVTRDGATPGTKLIGSLHNDIVQLFDKLIRDASITKNDLPDNVTNGYQLLEALNAKTVVTMQPTVTAIGNSITNLEAAVTTKTKIVQIGSWDMDADQQALVVHGITDITKIVDVAVMIRNDGGWNVAPLAQSGSNGEPSGWFDLEATQMTLSRYTTGIFDTVAYASTSTNRGYIKIEYIE